MSTCDICKSNKRSVCFITSRVKICQWCVSFLCTDPINPDNIIKYLEDTAEKYVNSLPQFQPVNIDTIKNEAIDEVGRLGLLGGTYLKIFKSKEYQQRQENIALKTNQKYQELIRSLEIEKKNVLDKTLTQIIERDHIPRKLRSIGYYGRRHFYEDIVSSKYIRYYNAIKFRLIAGETKVSRPTEEEWNTLRTKIKEQDANKCVLCGSRDGELHVHHIIPLYKYGTNDPDNLITLCYKCHDNQHPDIKVSRSKSNTIFYDSKKRKTLFVSQTGQRYVVLDLETTGISPSKGHRVIEIGAFAVVNGNIVDEFHSLVNPGIQIHYEVQRLTGITNQMLVGEPKPEKILPEFHRFINNSVLIAHNASFDIKFLKSEFTRVGLKLSNNHLCTLNISKKLYPRLGNYKLETVFNSLFIDDKSGIVQRHRALDDARLTLKIWLKMENNINYR